MPSIASASGITGVHGRRDALGVSSLPGVAGVATECNLAVLTAADVRGSGPASNSGRGGALGVSGVPGVADLSSVSGVAGQRPVLRADDDRRHQRNDFDVALGRQRRQQRNGRRRRRRLGFGATDADADTGLVFALAGRSARVGVVDVVDVVDVVVVVGQGGRAALATGRRSATGGHVLRPQFCRYIVRPRPDDVGPAAHGAARSRLRLLRPLLTQPSAKSPDIPSKSPIRSGHVV